MQGTQPVSYTHLDVYKRQEHHSCDSSKMIKLTDDKNKARLAIKLIKRSTIYYKTMRI